MDYKNKYLKYKTKYLKYKKILGGEIIDIEYRKPSFYIDENNEMKYITALNVIENIIELWRLKFGYGSVHISRRSSDEKLGFFLSCDGKNHFHYHIHILINKNNDLIYSPKVGNVGRVNYFIEITRNPLDIIKRMFETAGYDKNIHCTIKI